MAKTRLQYRVQASLYDVSQELLCDINQEPLLDINQDNKQLPLEKVAKQPANAIGKILNWNDLAPWRRDIHSKYISKGYRPTSTSFLVSFQSLLYIHNETVNIYTHLLPSLFTIPTAIRLHQILEPRYKSASIADITVFTCFFLAAAFSFAMSATFHTISNHSLSVARIGNTFDYIGIIGLITGALIPTFYYEFYCAPVLQQLYWKMICTIGFGCICVCLIIPCLNTNKWRLFRAAMFVSLGMSSAIPIVHGYLLYGIDNMSRQIGLRWFLFGGSLNILGAIIYAARFPERLRPGEFDILGSSHQIFHVLVVCAAVAHLTSLLNAFDYRHNGFAGVC